MRKILITKPHIDHQDLIEINKSIVDGWGENYLFYNNKFEDNFIKYIGSRYCISTYN